MNILVKYYTAFGDDGPYPLIRSVWLDAIHSPIDSIVYNLLADADDVDFGDGSVADWFLDQRLPAWSTLDEPEPYMELQNLFRHLADERGIPPCAIELIAW